MTFWKGGMGREMGGGWDGEGDGRQARKGGDIGVQLY